MSLPDVNDSWTDGHPSEGLLHEGLDDQLSRADAARVAAHVSGCSVCRARVAEARGLIAASHRILLALDGAVTGTSEPLAPRLQIEQPVVDTVDVPVLPLTQAAPAAAAPAPVPVVVQPTPAAPPRARAADHAAPRVPAAKRAPFRWQRWGQIAAVLVASVTGVVVWRNADLRTFASKPPAQDSAAAPAAAASPDVAPARAGSVADTGAIAGSAASLRAALERPRAPGTQPPVAAPPPASADAAANSARLDQERQRRMAAEAVAADPLQRTRLEAVPPLRDSTPPSSARKSFAAAPRAAMVEPFSAAPFDSLILTRSCTAPCTGYELHVNSSGAIVYLERSSRSAPRAVRAEIAPAARNWLSQRISRVLFEAGAVPQTGSSACTVFNDAHNVTLRLVVAREGSLSRALNTNSCTASPATLLALGAEIDSLAGVSRLQQSLPP